MLTRNCHLCFAISTLRCSQCNAVPFCSTEHQKLCWPTHKLNCGKEKVGKAFYIPQPDLTAEEWQCFSLDPHTINKTMILDLLDPETPRKQIKVILSANASEAEIKFEPYLNLILESSVITRIRYNIILRGVETQFQPPVKALPFYIQIILESYLSPSLYTHLDIESKPFVSEFLNECFRFDQLSILSIANCPEKIKLVKACCERIEKIVFPDSGITKETAFKYIVVFMVYSQIRASEMENEDPLKVEGYDIVALYMLIHQLGDELI